jgi:predicted O-methyltransferase YrrM
MAVLDTKLKELIDGFHEPLDEELKELRESNESEGVPLIMRETEGVLRLLLSLVRPKRILELGTAHGYSSLFFAKLLPDAQIITIDRNPYMIDKAKEVFATHSEAGRIELRVGDALETLEALRNEMSEDGSSEKFDFVFIDAAKSHYKEFLDIIEDISTVDAFIVCDNILLKGWLVDGQGKEAKRHRTNIKYMRQFLDYIKEREDLEVTILSSGDGMAVIKHK